MLHIGHAYAAWFARESGTRMLLRMEDIDLTRVRDEYDTAIQEDLEWLGVRWDGDIRRQSEHFEDYAAALDTLRDRGVVYPCFCTRRQIADEVARSGAAPQGPDGPLYPGTCRGLTHAERADRLSAAHDVAWRLDAARAAALTGPLQWTDLGVSERQNVAPGRYGDVVIARKDCPTSYHLSVVVDDALQGVTLVTRGEDLFLATDVQRLLQALLGLPEPLYRHHGLVCDENGRRLAKRDNATAVRALREQGWTPHQVRDACEARLSRGFLGNHD